MSLKNSNIYIYGEYLNNKKNVSKINHGGMGESMV